MINDSGSDLELSDISGLPVESEVDSCDRLIVVGIGASAGGLEAFTRILRALPTDTGMSFVLVQHLAPQHDSQLSEILQNATEMPVNEAKEGVRIEPNSVYVIPPNTLMTLVQGVLRLEPRQLVRGKYMVIDGFFSSLADDCGDRAIGVILSGNNEDGTAGIGAIKNAGGITFAQEIASAEFPTMPMIAIASGYVDHVLSPTDIAYELVNISQDELDHHTFLLDAIASAQDQSMFVTSSNNPQNLKLILDMLHNAMGVDFNFYKQGTIKRRMARRMGLLNLENLESYFEYLQEHPFEIEKLYHDVLINVTSFFRDPESFNILKTLVFPAICENKHPDSPIRIWVAGCATGEEVYSIAISLLEFLDDRPIKPQIQIFATDISTVVIDKARSGIYATKLLDDVSPERLRRFFVATEGGYQISKLVRNLCVFAQQNLTNDPPFSRLDLISCRNMLIYLEPVLQKKVMPIFHYALNPNGFLMLGSSEGVGSATDLFEAADKKNRIYKRRSVETRVKFNFLRNTRANLASNLDKRTEESYSESNLDQLVNEAIMRQYAPVGVLVNGDLEILQFRGQTSRYLEASPGKASLNLLKMARPALQLDLRSAIYNAKAQNIPIAKDGVELEESLLVKIDVIPLNVNNEQYFLVLFESRAKPINLASANVVQDNKSSKKQTDIEVARLTYELAKTKEYLQSVIEAQESANQDMKVAGEEILSSNEELQSANEELETAKEEIQSANEELNTINEELRSRNNQLHQVNNDMQNLLSSTNIPILMLSGDLKIRRFTPTARQLFNLIPSDVGRPFGDIHSNLAVPQMTKLIESVIDTLIPYGQDVTDNAGRWYGLKILPYRTTDNRIDGVVISLIDIDALKQNAIALESSRNYANTIIETLQQPLIVLNDEFEVITANRAFYQTFQLTAAQTEHNSIFMLGQKSWDIPKLRSLLNEILLLDITVQDFEVTQEFPQLGTRSMSLNACQIDQPNMQKMILIAIEDTTERNHQKQLMIAKNQQLTEAIATAEAASIAKSKFLGNMSHELRTPLNSIMGFVQILQDNPELDSESAGHLEVIYQASEYLLSLIEDLLDISRIEAEKIAIEPYILSLSNFLQITVDMIKFKVVEKKLTFTTEFSPDLPDTIYADEKRLRQIILNLLNNAIKFTNTGEITLSVNKIQSTTQTKQLTELIRFEISDTGIGMPESAMEKIFLPFEQVCESSTKSQGAGLGLAISQSLVNKMGGKIIVQSAIGVGSKLISI